MAATTQEAEGLLFEEQDTRVRNNSSLIEFLFPPWQAETISSPPTLKELLLVIVGCLVASVGAVICFYWQEVAEGDRKYSVREWANLVLSHCPLTAAIIFAAMPQGKVTLLSLPEDKIIRAAIYPAVIVVCWLFGNLMRGEFNPLAFCVTVMLSFLFVHSSYSIGLDTFTTSDAALIVAIGMMLDLRWVYTLWAGLGSFGYDWWSLALSMMMIAAFNTARSLRQVSISFVPKVRDLIGIVGGMFCICILVIPAGCSFCFLFHFLRTYIICIGLILSFFCQLEMVSDIIKFLAEFYQAS